MKNENVSLVRVGKVSELYSHNILSSAEEVLNCDPMVLCLNSVKNEQLRSASDVTSKKVPKRLREVIEFLKSTDKMQNGCC